MSPILPCPSSSRQTPAQDSLGQETCHTPRSPFPEPEEPPRYEIQQLTHRTPVLRVGMRRALVLSTRAGQELPQPPQASLQAGQLRRGPLAGLAGAGRADWLQTLVWTPPPCDP